MVEIKSHKKMETRRLGKILFCSIFNSDAYDV